MQILVLCLIISFVFGFIFAYKSKKITWGEFFAVSILSTVVIFGIYTAFYYGKLSDYRYVSDEVISVKYEPAWVSEYRCCKMMGSCCSGIGKKRSCHTCCKSWGTCTKKEGDFYNYTISNGEIFSLPRYEFNEMKEDLKEPEKITGFRPNYRSGDVYDYIYGVKKDVIIPWIGKEKWNNRIKASRNIIKYRVDDEMLLYKHPRQIEHILDYQNVIGIDDSVLSYRMVSEWNAKLKDKKVNIIIYGFQNGTHSDCKALDRFWIGGKNNEIILCLLYDEDNFIYGSQVISWTKNELLKTELTNLVLNRNIKDLKALETEIIDKIRDGFIINDFKEYSYLSLHWSSWDLFWMVSIFVMILIGVWYFCYNNDIDDDDF